MNYSINKFLNIITFVGYVENYLMNFMKKKTNSSCDYFLKQFLVPCEKCWFLDLPSFNVTPMIVQTMCTLRDYGLSFCDVLLG